MRSIPLAGLLLAAVLSAGAAKAETDPLTAVAFASRGAPLVRASLPTSTSPATRTGADALPKRSIDLRFSPKDVTGSVGFLCGREPGQSHTGSASAFGYDPHGRFLGAKLSRAF